MTRDKRIKVRLNEKEKALLDRKVKQSGLSREAYMRQLIALAATHEQPHPDYKLYTEQLHQIGIELNHVAHKYHVLGVIDVQRYDNACQNLYQTIDAIMNEVK